MLVREAAQFAQELRPRDDQAHVADHRLQDHTGDFGSLQFECFRKSLDIVRRAKAGPLVKSFLNGTEHARVGMAENQRTPRRDIIEVLIAIDVEKPGPLAAGDEKRLPAYGAESAGRTVHTARNDPAGS